MTDDFNIREASVVDAAQIAMVHTKTWQHAYAGIFPEDRLANMELDMETRIEGWTSNLAGSENLWAIFVVESRISGIVGFANLGQQVKSEFPQEAELFAIYILPEFQGKGIGRRLFTAVARKIQELGFSSLLLWVLKDNHSSRGFYERLGGRFAGTDDYQRWEQNYQITAYAWDSIDELVSK